MKALAGIAVMTLLASAPACARKAAPAPAPAIASARPVVIPASASASAPAPAAPPAKEPVSTQREALRAKLGEYGSGWAIENLEKDFTLGVEERPTEYVLTFTARGPSGLSTQSRLGKQSGFGGEALAIPPGPSLAGADLATADAVLKAARTLWVVPRTGNLAPLDVSRGTAGLRDALGHLRDYFPNHGADRALSTRLRDGFAVLYLRSPSEPALDPAFVIAIDLAKKRVVDAHWFELPPNDTRFFSGEDIAFLDKALKEHGDFGVYGSVTDGLVKLAKEAGVTLEKADDGNFHVSVSPRDEGGHFFSFTVDGHTGAIDGMTAGHSVPQPRRR